MSQVNATAPSPGLEPAAPPASQANDLSEKQKEPHSPSDSAHRSNTTASTTSHAVSNASQTSLNEYEEVDYTAAPPPLNYTVYTPARLRWVALFFILLFIDSGLLPLILFYSLEWGAHLSTTKNLAIITSLVGTTSGLKIAQRTYLLWFKVGSESRRPIGMHRWGVDAFHVLISIALAVYLVPLIIGSSLNPASPRAVAMALPCVMLTFSLPLLLTGLLPNRLRVPWRMSSFPAYRPLPPLTYTIVEDVIAVDGSGGLRFRHAWAHRYQASAALRALLRATALGWGASGTLVAAGLIVAAWLAPRDTAYGLGFGVPWIWALACTAATLAYTRRMLRRERALWQAAGARATYRHRRIPIQWCLDETSRAIEKRELQERGERTPRQSAATERAPDPRDQDVHPVDYVGAQV
ncbi:hypothetical protein PsYK624_077140 [Phanerochaete sordida]|uniref:Uncharacterized protein n=1 Tax=Phanerochaete sordida TaxID=48140 RepID=A0A9P3GD01_9APHY|nr:hypothetical protein PsYK624_077140 [Phanerochaete sordida]